ncbi:helix-turn-helix transcriptional regulator [Sphingomonas colocasiae]|uniref:AraC family transcriptional regulator n=1 Tax=Sphingomonas colocasiae TaxID=1848973 RepID=A0ABS7PQE7_9SPHN|nr:AraC family transcriptional regulator [Sphingomonas colocasiae]MBY8823411.1 AraC family transcriptional regulator [Sphingomonas colocasiae]
MAGQLKLNRGECQSRRFPPLAVDSQRVSVRYSVDDYVVDPAKAAGHLVGAFIPLSDRHHYRFDLQGTFGSGRHEFCGLADGFFIMFSETAYHAPQSRFISSPESLQIFIASQGDGEFVPAGGKPLSFEAPSAALVIEPADAPPSEVTFAGQARYIHMVVHRKALQALYAGGEQELPAALQTLLTGETQRMVARALPMGTATLRCVDDVHGCLLEGRRRRLWLHSKAIEIICQALEALDHSEGFQSVEVTRLTANGVMKAQRLLADNFVTPPSLEDLATEVGLSRSALCTGFRQILGQSVFDHIHDLRMQRALALLNQRGDSITQIAYAVGYNRASSFSVAVHRHFGATPSELRRRGTASAN